MPEGTFTYGIRAFNGSQRFDASCGSVTLAPPALTCTASVDGDQVTISLTDNGYSRVGVFRDGSWAKNVFGETSYTETVGAGTFSYDIRAFVGSQRTNATCGSVTVTTQAAPGLTCAASVANGNVTLSFTDVGAPSYQLRSANSWLQTVPAGQTSITVPDTETEYVIRHRLNGQVIDTTCA